MPEGDGTNGTQARQMSQAHKMRMALKRGRVFPSRHGAVRDGFIVK